MTDPWEDAVFALEQACCDFDHLHDAQQLAVLAHFEIEALEQIWLLDAPDALHSRACSPNDQRASDGGDGSAPV